MNVTEEYLSEEHPRRWNSTYYMLKRFKELEPALVLLAADNRSINAFYPDNDDWSSIEVQYINY